MFTAQDKEDWLKAKDMLEKEMSVISYDLWIKKLEIIDKQDGVVILVASTKTMMNMIN